MNEGMIPLIGERRPGRPFAGTLARPQPRRLPRCFLAKARSGAAGHHARSPSTGSGFAPSKPAPNGAGASRGSSSRRPAKGRPGLLYVLSLSIMSGLVISTPAWADSKMRDVRQGNALYQKGNYLSAIEQYNEALKKDPESAIINFNLGTVYYKNKDYSQAITHLQKSLLSENPALQAQASYNLGNAHYQYGIGQEENHLDMAILALERALSHYERALQMNPQDEDAKHNYHFVEKELERLKKKLKSGSDGDQSRDSQKQNKNEEKTDQAPSSQPRQQQGEQPPQPSQGQERNSSSESEKEQGQQPEDQESGAEESAGPEEKQQEPPSTKSESERESSPGDEERTEQPPPPPAAGGHAQNEMSSEEAEFLLDDYQQTEEPQGLLNTMKHKERGAPVLQDW